MDNRQLHVKKDGDSGEWGLGLNIWSLSCVCLEDFHILNLFKIRRLCKEVHVIS